MDTNSKCPGLSGLNILIIVLIAGFLVGILPIFEPKAEEAEANLAEGEIVKTEDLDAKLSLLQGNSLLPLSDPSNPSKPTVRTSGEIRTVVLTGYSSTTDQTDSDPFITAAGTLVREGVVATNTLPFGTKIKIPELFGDKVFVVEDRMHPRSGSQVDIWFQERWQALNFGIKRTYIEIL